jgi:acyl-[acyl-carrier-protein]-phospholipid O-acyltransferase/long-chain-fatty-acid--[acyl-carrier-protein] ligase
MSLARNRSFVGFVGAQFLGAFNDNLFKQLILFLAARRLFPGQDKQGLAFAVFALPFVIFSGIAGDLSERVSKRRVIVTMKVAEIAIMALGIVAFQMQDWTFLVALLALMGLHSTFFGPAKYGAIPEMVDEAGLLPANGVVSMTTFLAILVGQALAGALLDWKPDDLWVAGTACAAVAAVGLLFALVIRPLAPADPSRRVGPSPFGSLFSTIAELKADRGTFFVLIVNSFFWFDGGVIQQSITGLGGPTGLDLGPTENFELSKLLIILGVSIVVGSLLVPRAARYVPVSKLAVGGAFGMVLGQWGLTLVGPVVSRAAGGWWLAAGLLALIGLGGAFFTVPLQTFLQHAPPEGARGRTFAVNNFLNFLFIFLAGAWYLGLTAAHLPPALISALAGMVMLAAIAVGRRQVARLGELSLA